MTDSIESPDRAGGSSRAGSSCAGPGTPAHRHPAGPGQEDRGQDAARPLLPGPSAPGTGERATPAWRRTTEGESRWAVNVAVVAAIGIQSALPHRLGPRPNWLLPALEAALLAGLHAANRAGVRPGSRRLRTASLALAAVISLANGWAAARLVWGLAHGSEGTHAVPLLITAGGIWATNVIVFGLWYWEWDRGGPMSRARGDAPYPDFLFPQMQSPESAPPDWEPAFPDYLYLSFTNATAFSPTDVLPMTRWAKMLMMVQSAVSLVTVVLVVARAVNLLT